MMLYLYHQKKEVIKMKCKICKRKINYNNSIGRDTFLVCTTCIQNIKKRTCLENMDVLNTILAIGFMMEDYEER